MLSLKTIAHLSSKRLFSTLSNNVLEHLSNRTLIKISGSDVSNYLQGLITNDIEHLNSGPGSMYAVFLNTAGRVLYDTIIYRNLEKDTYLIECDKQVTDTLQKHLKLHRVRRKIDVINLTEELKIYALFNNETCEQIDNLQVSDGTASFRAHQDLLIYRDPRVASLGSRIITKTDINVHNQLSEVVNIKENESSGCSYRWLRYKLGVGEGIEDLPTGECFPLESNCDYLHGVSFHKGCYIGQELTARIHHTGVVRKRLMPIDFSKVPLKYPEKKIVQDNVNLGKLRGIEKDVGLALLKINDALAAKQIKIGDGIGVTSRPNWWPAEAPKEKANISKLQ